MTEERYLYDVLEHHSYRSRDPVHAVGDRIELFGGDYEVVDVSPPIGAGTEATLVVRLYSGARPEDLQRVWPEDWRHLGSA
ncbi:MAG TPA: hypothetical protein VJ689_03820 [Gaiellaceae bacterium]|jgi:hypothetical protein|nr:hypothetical protein [Gaiellaceae bacterium]